MNIPASVVSICLRNVLLVLAYSSSLLRKQKQMMTNCAIDVYLSITNLSPTLACWNLEHITDFNNGPRGVLWALLLAQGADIFFLSPVVYSYVHMFNLCLLPFKIGRLDSSLFGASYSGNDITIKDITALLY